jgi:hypothetical protein
MTTTPTKEVAVAVVDQIDVAIGHIRLARPDAVQFLFRIRLNRVPTAV